MAYEIERKFLVVNQSYRENAEGVLYKQAYLNSSSDRIVRIRIIGQKGYITIKGPSEGCKRLEFEYEIPYSDAQIMFECLCEKPILEKYRYKVNINDLTWEVDEFMGENKGLIIAELELPNEKHSFTIPNWLGQEVTNDPKYYNSNLIKNPFIKWEK